MAIIVASNLRLFVDGKEIDGVNQASIDCNVGTAVPLPVSTSSTSFSATATGTMAPGAMDIVNDLIVSSRLGGNWKN